MAGHVTARDSGQPESLDALLRIAGIDLEAGRARQAADLMELAVGLHPRSVDAHYLRANALFDLSQFDAAIAAYRQVLEWDPTCWRACNNAGLALLCQRRHESALRCFEQAIGIEPRNPEAFNFRGHALGDLGDHAAAVASYDAALALQPGYAEALNGRGNALALLRRPACALQSYDRALAVRPDFADPHFNRGNVLIDLGRDAEAVASYQRATQIKPDFAEAHYKLGDAHRGAGRIESAAASYDKALGLRPDLKYLRGTRLHAKMQLCDWRDLEGELDELTVAIERGEAACPPFALLALSGSTALHRRVAAIYCREECAVRAGPVGLRPRGARPKIRIGYVSADFRHHPVSLLCAALFEMHDRAAFDVVGLSTGPDTQDAVRRRLEAAFDRFIDVRDSSDEDIAQLARSLELDIAIDLGGFTQHARPQIFARRIAPLQVSYLGYLGTMAAPFIDYLIADRTLIPAEARPHYSENILYLPSYQANDPQRQVADIVMTRGQWGLPPSGFVFCCFNASYKIVPSTFAGWMRILRRVPGSVLWLYGGRSSVENNLRAAAHDAGVDPGRLLFGASLPLPEYLARYRAADLFLDTLPYNAGTTASDALWAGLPVLTRTGEALAGRMAASLLMSLNLPELIAPTQIRYEDLAVELAQDGARLAQIRQRLIRQRSVAALFDIGRFTRSLEAGYRTILERHLRGLAPTDVDVGGA